VLQQQGVSHSPNCVELKWALTESGLVRIFQEVPILNTASIDQVVSADTA
jgi:hypothetical protein